jgi:hypothetical protein
LSIPQATAARPERPHLTTRRLIAFAVLAALLATFLTDYRYAEVGLEEIDPMVRRAIDPGFLANDFFTNVTDEFGPRFYSTRLIAAVATPGSLPAIYFGLTLLINVAIAIVTGLFGRELFRSNVAGLIAVALVMGATSFQLGGAGQAHAGEPNSYWMSFPFAIAAVWAATRARPVLVGLLAGLVSVLHPTFGAGVGGLIFLSLITGLWARRRQDGTRVPLAGIAVGLVLFVSLLASVAVPYSSGARIPEGQLFEIMRLRMPHHILPSTFNVSDWVRGLLFMVALGIAWRWLRQKDFPDRFQATVLSSLTAGLLLFFVAGYLFVEVWPWKPWFIAIPYRSMSFLLWVGLWAIGGSAAHRILGNRTGEGIYLQVSSFNPISSGLGHLASIVKERRDVMPPLLIAAGVVALAVGIPFTQPRDLVQFAVVNGLAVWFVAGPDRVWASVVEIAAPVALAVGLFTYQTVVHTEGVIDRVGPEIFPSQVEGPEASIARAARDLTPVDAVILTPPTFGTFRVLSERAIVVDTRDIPYQEDAMAEWMDRIITIYGVPVASGLESQDFGRDEYEALDDAYRVITDQTIANLCGRYPITYAVLFSDTSTSFPVLESNDTYQLVELDDC